MTRTQTILIGLARNEEIKTLLRSTIYFCFFKGLLLED